MSTVVHCMLSITLGWGPNIIPQAIALSSCNLSAPPSPVAQPANQAIGDLKLFTSNRGMLESCILKTTKDRRDNINYNQELLYTDSFLQFTVYVLDRKLD